MLDGDQWLTPVPAAESWFFAARARDMAPAIGVARAGEPVPITFTRGATLALTVTGADRPLGGASATLLSWNGRIADGVLVPRRLLGESGAGGTLTLDHLPAGTLVLLVSRDGAEARVEVTVGDGETKTESVRLP